MEDLRYPIGEFELRDGITEQDRSALIGQIEDTPALMREAVAGLTDEQLDTPYREGGWTVRQVVHHVADSHINGYIRFRWAATEDNPTLKPYDGDRSAELADGKAAPPEVSLDLLDALHRRWTLYLRSLGPDDLARRIEHPESGPWTVDGLL